MCASGDRHTRRQLARASSQRRGVGNEHRGREPADHGRSCRPRRACDVPDRERATRKTAFGETREPGAAGGARDGPVHASRLAVTERAHAAWNSLGRRRRAVDSGRVGDLGSNRVPARPRQADRSPTHGAQHHHRRALTKASEREHLLPSWRSLASPDPDGLAEERRLFYVACTRAKDRLAITHAATRNGRPTGGPSRFLAEAGLTDHPRALAA
jgi:UvrD-like helicase C-terminal domain